ncbi:MAG TPA: formate--phosphoribosylaminoimidazolecarboxamide ligase [Candidatus Saccharimonadales bacterium]|nr:formate--phosphoribosylaminoimidazolecarboxamide ligase [Candidatus Saccharimonadales bacterium]
MAARTRDYKICTLASHSALQILKGAHDEGFKTIAICEEGHRKPYESFRVADEIIMVKHFSEVATLDAELAKKDAVLIPHGSLVNALDTEGIDRLRTPYYGNKHVLPWEADRDKQREWLADAGLTLPRIYADADDIDGPAIVKFYGAGGGKGYFLAHTPAEFKEKIAEHPGKRYIIQEYIVGAPIYAHYFYSSLTGELEIMGFDKRYESNVDSVGRISAKDQLDLNIETSYNITGNMPLVVRESLLPTLFDMGERVIEASKKLDGIGLFGPFCLETVITPDLEFYVFEISARIVAGTNPYVNGSPYTDLRYGEPMSTGRRIAHEIKQAIAENKLDKVFVNGHA